MVCITFGLRDEQRLSREGCDCRIDRRANVLVHGNQSIEDIHVVVEIAVVSELLDALHILVEGSQYRLVRLDGIQGILHAIEEEQRLRAAAEPRRPIRSIRVQSQLVELGLAEQLVLQALSSDTKYNVRARMCRIRD